MESSNVPEEGHLETSQSIGSNDAAMHDTSLTQEHSNSSAGQSVGQSSSLEASQAKSAERESDPFAHLKKAHKFRENVQARVVKWQRNGLEMELEDGTKAFMPNDMIDRDPNRNIANYFGKTLPVRITNIKLVGKKADVSVSHRAVIEDELRHQGKEKIETLSVGDVIETKIKSFNNNGAVVDIGAGIEAVIRTRDLTWANIEHPYEAVKRGDTVTAKILQLDKGRRRAQLGIRQLTPDPFLEKFSKYTAGQILTGKVVHMNDFGAELELEPASETAPGITAFLPISEISWTRIPTVQEVMKEGDEIEVKLLSADPDTHKLTASKKQLIENPLRKIENTYRVGTDHTGTIKEVNKGGVVVDLPHGAEGFVPRRELSHDRIERLEDLFKPGKLLEGLRVMEYDRRNGRVTLSYIAAERDAQRSTLKNYKPTSRASSFALGDLASLKEKLEKLEREG